jgi:hypothetical protein
MPTDPLMIERHPGPWPEVMMTVPAPAASVVFTHTGPVARDGTGAIVAQVEMHSIAMGDGMGLRKRLIGIVLEGLDNIRMHTPAEESGTGFAGLFDEGDGYRLIIGNAMPLATAELLAHRTGILNEMDDTDLREQFMKLLALDARTVNGGAGLGLITMARRCARPMVAHRLPKDDRTVYFALELRVPRN